MKIVKEEVTKVSKLGFTLVETLLYLAITSTILLVVFMFVGLMLEARIKFQAIAEVEQQGTFVMQTILKNIKTAQSVNYPAVGESSDSLSLTSLNFQDNPIIFNENAGLITQRVGNLYESNLLASNVHITSISFLNASRPNTPGVVRVQFSLQYNGSQNQQYSNYQAEFEGSASLVQ